jgi:hypothetical protein
MITLRIVQWVLIAAMLGTTVYLLDSSLWMMPMVCTAVVLPPENRAILDRSAEDRLEIARPLCLISSLLIVLQLFAATVSALYPYKRKHQLVISCLALAVLLAADIVFIPHVQGIINPPIITTK